MLRAMVLMFVGTCLFFTTPALPNDLVRLMEIEIKIQELSRATLEESYQRARAAIRKTSLWRKYRAVSQELEPNPECMKVGIELDRKGTGRGYKKSLELLNRMREVCAKHVDWAMTDEYKRLSHRSSILYNDILALQNQFKEALYVQEMKRKLTELAIGITKDVLKKIERSYKKWEA